MFKILSMDFNPGYVISFFLIIVFIAVMVYAYRCAMTLARFPDSQYGPLEYFLATDFGMVVTACAVLVPTLALLGMSEPMGRAERLSKTNTEYASYEYRGYKMAGLLVDSYAPKKAKPAPATSDSPAAATAPAATTALPPTDSTAAPVAEVSTVPETLKVLLVGAYENDAQKQYYLQQKAGLLRGFKTAGVKNVEWVEQNLTYGEPPKGAQYNFDGHPRWVWPQLDTMVKAIEGLNMVVMLVDLPEDYGQSTTAYRCSAGTLKVGAFSGNVYTNGVDIDAGKLSVVVTPRLLEYSTQDYLPTADLDDDFSNRYLVLTPDRVELAEILKANPRLFLLRRQL